ncbi:MAG: hypothetical protein J6C61_04630 [Clostridia bacterium]|nr:hypothetical protein [Clostridia bacterium]
MDLSKNEVLEKLDTISSRYGEVVAIKKKMNSFVPNDIYARQVEVPDFPEAEGGEANTMTFKSTVDHTDESGADFMRVYETLYKLPPEPKEPEKQKFVAPQKPIILLILYVVTTIAALAGIINFFNFALEILTFSLDWGDLFTLVISVFALIIAGAVFIGSIFVKKAHKEKEKAARTEFEKKQQDIIDAYNEKLNQHKREVEAYRQKEQDYIDAYWVWRTVYIEHLDEEERVKAQLEIDRQAAVKEIEKTELVPAQEALNEANDLISEEYLPVIDKLISLIKSGRADSLKEAINLHEEILFKERELRLEREKEERRQYEAMLRLAAEQARHEAEMEFQREQEAQRQAEERYRRQEDERRHREEMELLEKQESNRQAEARREESRRKHEETAAMYRDYHATHRQCQSCANMTHCRMAFQRSNCASYVPK